MHNQHIDTHTPIQTPIKLPSIPLQPPSSGGGGGKLNERARSRSHKTIHRSRAHAATIHPSIQHTRASEPIHTHTQAHSSRVRAHKIAAHTQRPHNTTFCAATTFRAQYSFNHRQRNSPRQAKPSLSRAAQSQSLSQPAESTHTRIKKRQLLQLPLRPRLRLSECACECLVLGALGACLCACVLVQAT